MGASVDTTMRLTYIRPAPYAGALGQEFKEHGIRVHREPPLERKDLSTALAAVSVAFAVTASVGDIVAGVRAFKARHQGTQVQAR